MIEWRQIVVGQVRLEPEVPCARVLPPHEFANTLESSPFACLVVELTVSCTEGHDDANRSAWPECLCLANGDYRGIVGDEAAEEAIARACDQKLFGDAAADADAASASASAAAAGTLFSPPLFIFDFYFFSSSSPWCSRQSNTAVANPASGAPSLSRAAAADELELLLSPAAASARVTAARVLSLFRASRTSGEAARASSWPLVRRHASSSGSSVDEGGGPRAGRRGRVRF